MRFQRIAQVLLIIFPLVITAQTATKDPVYQKLLALETSSGGQLGVVALNTANHKHLHYHANKRFATGSTFKIIGVGAVLKQSMRNPQFPQRSMMIKKQDLTAWCPVTAKHVGQTMSVFDLSAAAIMYSDNTAINLLMEALGGPQEVVIFARAIGDDTFKMNSTIGNLNPTSTPAAMAKTLEKLALGHALGAPQRQQLITWMKKNTTGDLRIRAGVPKGWVVADKTGSGEYGLTNDIAIIWPPNQPPILVAIYFTQTKKNATSRPAIIAEATRIVLGELTSKKKRGS